MWNHGDENSRAGRPLCMSTEIDGYLRISEQTAQGTAEIGPSRKVLIDKWRRIIDLSSFLLARGLLAPHEFWVNARIQPATRTRLPALSRVPAAFARKIALDESDQMAIQLRAHSH